MDIAMGFLVLKGYVSASSSGQKSQPSPLGAPGFAGSMRHSLWHNRWSIGLAHSAFRGRPASGLCRVLAALKALISGAGIQAQLTVSSVLIELCRSPTGTS